MSKNMEYYITDDQQRAICEHFGEDAELEDYEIVELLDRLIDELDRLIDELEEH